MAYPPTTTTTSNLNLSLTLVDVKLVPIAFKQSIQGIDNLNDIGCFGLTELGYGNNAVEMETTATYDNETKGFNQDGKEVCYFKRKVLIWKRDAAPDRKRPYDGTEVWGD